MELSPGVVPAASDPKFNESSSILSSLAVFGNSSCRKRFVFSKSSPYLNRKPEDPITSDDTYASKLSENVHAIVHWSKQEAVVMVLSVETPRTQWI